MPDFSHSNTTTINEETIRPIKRTIPSRNIINRKCENRKLDNVFNDLKTLSKQAIGKLENMIALALISESKHEKAIPYLRTAAQNGYHKAQYNLAVSYQDGLGVEKDEKMVNFYLFFSLCIKNS